MHCRGWRERRRERGRERESSHTEWKRRSNKKTVKRPRYKRSIINTPKQFPACSLPKIPWMLSRSAQTKGANYQSTERTKTHTHTRTHSLAPLHGNKMSLRAAAVCHHWTFSLARGEEGWILQPPSGFILSHPTQVWQTGGKGSRSDFKRFCRFFQNACKHVEKSRRVYIFNRTFQKQDNVKHKACIVHTSTSVSFMNTPFTMRSGLSVDTQPDFLDSKTTACVKKKNSTSLFVQLVPLIWRHILCAAIVCASSPIHFLSPILQHSEWRWGGKRLLKPIAVVFGLRQGYRRIK